jgi:small conductance mechanosensitive channel
MNYFSLLDVSAADNIAGQTSKLEAFFSADNLKTLFNEFVGWGVGFIGSLILAFIIWKIGKRLIKWILKINHRALSKADVDEGAVRFISSIVRLVLYAILIFIIIDTLGFQTTSIVTLFGSAALAIGISLQGSLSNFAGGVLILIFHPFRIGDYIVSGNSEGTVVSIDILYTKLRTVDNKIVFMPNGALSNSNITNVGSEGVRRLDIEIGIGYGSDVPKAKQLLMDIMQGIPELMKDKELKVIVKSLDDSCVTLETRAWVKQEDYWNVRFSLLEKYKTVFDANGIEIPFNQLDVHVKTED